MDELRIMSDVGILYSTYIKEDSLSFVRFPIHKNEENILTSLPTFKAFSEKLKAEGLAGETPKALKLQIFSKSFDFCKKRNEKSSIPTMLNRIPQPGS
jgi:hypothetical protein